MITAYRTGVNANWLLNQAPGPLFRVRDNCFGELKNGVYPGQKEVQAPSYGVGRSIEIAGRRLWVSTLIHGPRTTALGPLLERRETRCRNRLPVTRLVLLQ